MNSGVGESEDMVSNPNLHNLLDDEVRKEKLPVQVLEVPRDENVKSHDWDLNHCDKHIGVEVVGDKIKDSHVFNMSYELSMKQNESITLIECYSIGFGALNSLGNNSETKGVDMRFILHLGEITPELPLNAHTNHIVLLEFIEQYGRIHGRQAEMVRKAKSIVVFELEKGEQAIFLYERIIFDPGGMKPEFSLNAPMNHSVQSDIEVATGLLTPLSWSTLPLLKPFVATAAFLVETALSDGGRCCSFVVASA
nr:hypothetical protein Iba_chr05cCG19490 [Ipomoea batatas]